MHGWPIKHTAIAKRKSRGVIWTNNAVADNLPSESGPLKCEHVSAIAKIFCPRRTSRMGTPSYIARVGVLSANFDSARMATKFFGNTSPAVDQRPLFARTPSFHRDELKMT